MVTKRITDWKILCYYQLLSTAKKLLLIIHKCFINPQERAPEKFYNILLMALLLQNIIQAKRRPIQQVFAKGIFNKLLLENLTKMVKFVCWQEAIIGGIKNETTHFRFKQ